MSKDQFRKGDTGKLNVPRTSELDLTVSVDRVKLSSGVKSEGGSAVDSDSAKRLGDLYAEIARSRNLLDDLAGPLTAIRMALGLIRGDLPESQLFAGCSADEKDYVRALALHLVDSGEYRKRSEIAMAQFASANEQVQGLERQIQEAAIAAQTLGTEAFRELKLEKIRGIVHPLAILHVTFEGDEMLSGLVPPPRKLETRMLEEPEDGFPGTGTLAEGAQELAKFARKMVRKAMKALLYPPPPTGKGS